MKFLASLVLSLALFISNQAYAAEGIINMNAGLVPDDNRVVTLTRSEVISILMGQRTFWNNGTKVTVYLLPRDNIATREFLFNLGIPPNAYFDSLNSMYSAGRTNVPVILPTDIAMLVNTANTSGAIGYIRSRSLADLMPSVYILRIGERK